MELPKAILFDLDDTLVSFEGISDLAWHNASGRFSVPSPELF